MSAKLQISMELIRQMLDLPDDLHIIGATTEGWEHDSDLDLTLPRYLTLDVNSVHIEPNDRYLVPVYSSKYEGDVARVTLERIDGYRGPIDRRPSFWREKAVAPTDGGGASHG